jgi:hypothetical protein
MQYASALPVRGGSRDNRPEGWAPTAQRALPILRQQNFIVGLWSFGQAGFSRKKILCVLREK